jgi:hypothetical protein
MVDYEILIFNLYNYNGHSGLDTDSVYSMYNNSDKFIRYHDILAIELSKNIKNSKIFCVNDSKNFVRSDGNLYISNDDEYGIIPDKDGIFHIFDFIVIKNTKTNKYVIIDFQDGPKHSKVLTKNKNCVLQYSSMYLDMIRNIFDVYNSNCELKPFTFYDITPYHTKQYVDTIQKIRSNSEIIPKMVFYGTLGDTDSGLYCTHNSITDEIEEVRKVVKVLKEKYPDLIDIQDRDGKLERSEWWKLAANYSVALTVPGHPWCYREHEFWALGIPTLANTYTCPLLFPLIPDKHYVDAGTSGKDYMDREIDQEFAADLIARKFLEVKNHNEYLSKIASNAKLRYDTYIYPPNSAKLLISDIKNSVSFL